MQKLIFILFLSLSISVTLFAQNDEQKKEITERMSSLKQALSDDVTYGHSNGLVQTKAQLVRDVMGGVQDYKSIEASDMSIRIYNDAAIASAKSKVDLTYGGKPLSLNMYITSTWIKMNNDWKLVARQSVKLPE